MFIVYPDNLSLLYKCTNVYMHIILNKKKKRFNFSIYFPVQRIQRHFPRINKRSLAKTWGARHVREGAQAPLESSKNKKV